MSSSTSSIHAFVDDDTPPTRTVTSISIVHARPEHLQSIHDIQAVCYKDQPSFHESIDVFRSKIDHYPAGNFVALATYSVVTDQHDPGQLWSEPDQQGHQTSAMEEDRADDTDIVMEAEEEEEENDGDDDDDEKVEKDNGEDKGKATASGGRRRGSSNSSVPSSIVEILITEEGDEEEEEEEEEGRSRGGRLASSAERVTIVRARTPDISTPVSDDDDDEDKGKDSGASKGRKANPVTATSSSHKTDHATTTVRDHTEEDSEKEEEDEDPVISILAQWEQPIGYLISHPFHRETATLHKLAPSTAAAADASKRDASHSTTRAKKARLDHAGGASGGGGSGGGEGGAGAGTHHKSSEASMGDGIPTPTTTTIEEMSEIDERDDHGDDSDDDRYEHDPFVEKYFLHDMAILPEFQGQGLAYLLFHALERNTVTTTMRSGCTVTMPRRWNRRGAPNVKELHLISVQGSRPFWENRPAFRVCQDHDLDLSVYGEGALYMTRQFHF
ncbi:hypothetical protein DFQ27_006171 [Actinomortierella ambigua]|uniref:Uncharacterized protein n=1 Tax=Actinomortierella ambigua TaxID=1343610 RepID=A0A9P6U0V1_9FUNG|nr:hypothetical protein DFQ27_006171 [Actinomortierella ambigua]